MALPKIFSSPSRVTNNISAYIGYENSTGHDLRIKLNNQGEIIFILGNPDGLSLNFKFDSEDKEYLNRFHALMTNVFAHTSIMDGKKVTSKKKLECSVIDEFDTKLSITVNNTNEVSFVLTNEKNESIEFQFKTIDKDILNKFKKEFNDMINNISKLTLPKNTVTVNHKPVEN